MIRRKTFPLSGSIAAAAVAQNPFVRGLAVSLIGLCVAQCMPEAKLTPVLSEVVAPSSTKAEPDALPKGIGYDKTGKPYTVAGRLYVPREEKGYSATGLASWYGPSFHGKKTANGEVFDRNSVSIAHPTMPLPSYVRVTNILNGRSIIARANDRGPFHGNRLVDVSEQVAIGLNFKHLGTARLKVDYIGRAPVSTDDTGMLMASLRTDGSPAQLGRAGASSVVAAAKATPAQSQPALRKDTEEEAAPVSQPTSQFVAGEAGLPLPPVRPFTIGDSGFRPQFAALNSAIASPLVNDPVEGEITQPAAPVTAAVPLPPVRPDQFSASEDTVMTEKPAASAKAATPVAKTPVAIPANGFVPVTVPVQRWNKGA